MKNILKLKRILSMYIAILMIFSSTIVFAKQVKQKNNAILEDFDPLEDIEVTVEILDIRSLEKFEYPHPAFEIIDFLSKPDFYVKITINGEEFVSDVWQNTRYIYDAGFKATLNVPDEEEFVDINIQLWGKNSISDKQCDISSGWEDTYNQLDANLEYSIATGHWRGDDYSGDEHSLSDPSGYGRLNGCDDNSIYQRDRDCEIWFDIYQNDYDGDGIPYWTEVNVFGTDPEVDNTGEDLDEDGVPIEWEYKWGHQFSHWGSDDHWFYDPFVWENHTALDPDNDGLNNVEEYLTSQWGSDPFRKDIFIEIDQMEAGPDGEGASLLPDGSKELLMTAFDRYNIVLHLDDGSMGGGEMVPFSSLISRDDLSDYYYQQYFLHGDQNNWRRGVFRYGIVVWDAGYPGYNFRNGAFQISKSYVDKKAIIKVQRMIDVVYASVYMHELGHTLGIYNPGVDNDDSDDPSNFNFWKYGPYKSCMNYRYTYRLVDYSDGSRGKNDFPDWYTLDLTSFQGGFF